MIPGYWPKGSRGSVPIAKTGESVNSKNTSARRQAAKPAPPPAGGNGSKRSLDTSPRVGPFAFTRVEHQPDESPPLVVVIRFNRVELRIPCRANHLQTFARFQAHVAELHGIWLSHPAERGARSAAYWREDIQDAFNRGAA